MSAHHDTNGFGTSPDTKVRPTPLSKPLPLILLTLIGIGLTLIIPAPVTKSQEGATPPHWVWYPDDPVGQAPAQTRYFRKVFRVKELSRLTLDVTADNRYTLWLDGQELASGSDWTFAKHLELAVPTGIHVLSVEAENDDVGPAGLLIQGGILPLGQGVPIHTGSGGWRASQIPPQDETWKTYQFEEGPDWMPVRDLGTLGVGPWSQRVVFESGDASERFRVPDGFRIRQAASMDLTGSAVSLAFDPEGNPCIGVERGPVVRLIDENDDGRYDRRQIITPQMTNCQSVAFIDGHLFAVGQGPEGVAIYQLDDEDGDGVFESSTVVRKTTHGMGEHGPHALRLGPDGDLYFNAGNHAHLVEPIAEDSPHTIMYEGELLPHLNDARGHARDRLAPGGEIYRSPDGGATWERVSAGYRNHYDYDFNRDGEIFTFDSDMEWDIGLPWYRPVRVVHATPGSEFGWRNGSGKWPSYFFDSLPSVLGLGRGSPTGVTFYRGQQFPADFDDAFLILDWSQGRILAVDLQPEGASYRGRARELVSGQPLNCTDIAVGPEGSVYFTTGGRGTQGGLFRVTWTRSSQPAPPDDPILEALTIASPLVSFSQARLAEIRQEAGPTWPQRLTEVAASAESPVAQRRRALDLMAQFGPEPSLELLTYLAEEPQAKVRAHAVLYLGRNNTPEGQTALVKALADSDSVVARRACEALVRARHAIPVGDILPLLSHPDRWVRFAARNALEHAVDAEGTVNALRTAAGQEENPRRALESMLVLVRATELDDKAQTDLLQRQTAMLQAELSNEQRLDLLRLIGLTFLRGPVSASEFGGASELVAPLLESVQGEDRRLRIESARLLAYLDAPEAVPAILNVQANPRADRAEQIHDAFCLRVLSRGWSTADKMQLMAWYEAASHWDGGFSYLGYLDNMARPIVATLSEAERGAILQKGREIPFPTRLVVAALDLDAEPAVIDDLFALYNQLDASINRNAVAELRSLIIDRLGTCGTDSGRLALRRLFDLDPERRNPIARALAAQPTSDDRPILVEGLLTNDRNTALAVLKALIRQETSSGGDPQALRNLLIMARQVAPFDPSLLNRAATQFSRLSEEPPADFDDALGFWEQVYTQRFPDAMPLRSGASTDVAVSYSLELLVAEVVQAQKYREAASPTRGERVLLKARCLDCHKYGALGGQGLGPDLTTLSSRFRPEEILEAIVHPSRVISDQYQSLSVATLDGLIYSGMPISSDDRELVLLLADGNRQRIAKNDIDEQAPSDISVMPEGLLNTLTRQEIADLLALFASAPRVETPASDN